MSKHEEEIRVSIMDETGHTDVMVPKSKLLERTQAEMVGGTYTDHLTGKQVTAKGGRWLRLTTPGEGSRIISDAKELPSLDFNHIASTMTRVVMQNALIGG